MTDKETTRRPRRIKTTMYRQGDNWTISKRGTVTAKEVNDMINQIQQGDVIIKRIDFLPNGCVEVKRQKGAIILAEGEATGHAHRIMDVDAMSFDKDGKLFLTNSKTVTVKHEEHKPVTIEPGIWEVGQVREKDWLSGMVREVVD